MDVERDVRSALLWNDSTVPRLWLYQVHYFDYLSATETGEEHLLHQSLVNRWIQENPIGRGAGWEPYPLSVRIRNWIKWQLRHAAFSASALNSLALQVRWLVKRMEFHLLGNHLLENLIALKCASLFFEGEEADSWAHCAEVLLERELLEQILPDGGHQERSPMYQAIVLEALLDLLNIGRATVGSLPHHLAQVCSRMLDWLAVMTHPDGDIAYFNDAVTGMSLRLSALEGYAAALGVEVPPRRDARLRLLEHSGFARLSAGPAVLICDVGGVGPRHQPGHAHAGTLSFELSIARTRVVVNSGTSTYEASPLRQYERSTAAHSVLRYRGADSTEVWHAFRAGRRAQARVVQTSDAAAVELCAEHDGYLRLRPGIVHRRSWELAADTLRVIDRVDGGSQRGDVDLFLHLGPGVGAKSLPDGGHELAFRDGTALLTIASWAQLNVRLESGSYALGFGRRVANPCVVASASAVAPSIYETRFSWVTRTSGPGQVADQ